METPTSSLTSLLPTELFVEILSFTLPQSLSDEYVSPTGLCLICRSWRNIVVGSPQLWAVLKFSSSQLYSLFTSNVTQVMMYTLLARSGDVPLSLSLDVVYKREEEVVRAVIGMPSVQHRLEVLHFKIERFRYRYQTGQPPASYTGRISRDTYPQLREVKLSAYDPVLGERVSYYGVPVNHFSSFLSLVRALVISSSSLQHFEVSGIPSDDLLYEDPEIIETAPWSLSKADFFSSSVTSVKIDVLHSTTQGLHVFRAFPLIRTCKIICCVRYESHAPLSRSIVTDLRNLSLKGILLVDFLNSLQAPALKSLTISIYTRCAPAEGEPRLSDALHGFLQHTGCSLEELVLEGIAFNAEEFERVFKAAHSIDTLRVRSEKSSILDALCLPRSTSRDPSGIPCQHLRRIQLDLGSEVARDALIKTLAPRIGGESRIFDATHLEHAQFSFPGFSTATGGVEELRALGGTKSTFERVVDGEHLILRW